MAGFSNNLAYATNADFSGATIPLQTNGLQNDKEMWIGVTTPNSGGTHINKVTLTNGTNFAFTQATNTLTGGLSGIIGIVNGGTNAGSFSTSTGIVKFDGTRLVTSATAKIDASNRMTNTAQPLVIANLSANLINVTGDGTVIAAIIFDNIISQQGTSYNNTTGSFVAPVTGYYSITAQITYLGLGVAHNLANQFIETSPAAADYMSTFNPGVLRNANNNVSYTTTKFLGLNAGDSFNIQTMVSGSTKTVGISGGTGPFFTWLNVFLIC